MKPSLNKRATYYFPFKMYVFILQAAFNIRNRFLMCFFFFKLHHILLVSLNTAMRCKRNLTKDLTEEKNKIFLCITAVLLVNTFSWTHNVHSKLFWRTENTRKCHLLIKMRYVTHWSHFKLCRRHSCLAIITMILNV